MDPAQFTDTAAHAAQQLWPSFQNPLWLWLLPPVLVAMGLLYLFASRSRKHALSTFAAQRLLGGLLDSVSPARRTFKAVLLFAAVALLMLAAARPQYGYRWSEARSRGIDIMFVLDASRSMLATDIKPDRLQRAKLAILDFVEKLDGDRIGLVAFAGDAFVQCPLTLDYHAFDQSLEAVDTNVIPIGGTDLAKAVDIAEGAFEKDNNHKILILITDGEDLEGAGLKRAQQAADQGITIYAVGVGTAEGSLIPLTDRYGRHSFVTDENGKPVTTRLEAETLTQIANATGGFYVPLGSAGQGLETVYKDGLQSIPRKELAARMQRHGIDRFQWPLGLAVILLAWEPLLSNRRGSRIRRLWQARQARQRKDKTAHTHLSAVVAVGLGIAVLALTAPQAQAASLRRAESLYRKGEYEAAKRAYEALLGENPDSAKLHYNLANTLHALGEHTGAQESYTKVLHGDDLKLQEDAFYNLGLSQYATGENALAKATPEQTLAASQQARIAAAQAISNGGRVLSEAERLRKQAEATTMAADTQTAPTVNRPLQNSDVTAARPQGTATDPTAAQPEIPQQMVQQAIQLAEQSKDATQAALTGNQTFATEAQNATQAWQRAQASFHSAAALAAGSAADAAHNIEQTEKSIDALRARIHSDEQANAAHRADIQTLEQLIEELKKLLKQPPQDDNQQNQDNQQDENNDQNQDNQQDQQNQQQDQQSQQDNQQNQNDNQQDSGKSQQNQQSGDQQQSGQQDSSQQDNPNRGQQNQDNQQNENNGQNQDDQQNQDDSQQQQPDEDRDRSGESRQNGQQNQQPQSGNEQQQDNAQEGEGSQREQSQPQQPESSDSQQGSQRSGAEDEQRSAAEASDRSVPLTQEQREQLAAAEQMESGDAGLQPQPRAGAMSRQEAAGLLESLRRSGKILPLSGQGQRQQTTRPQRDW